MGKSHAAKLSVCIKVNKKIIHSNKNEVDLEGKK
jgi:hypothetical protein